AGKVKTVQGQDLTVTTNMGVMVDQSKVIATDVAASNGVIHAIDTVLMPK
ncbi:MAG: fasciclin domain-containing protein, partial [Acidovorax sp.]|nr:fasciclin domain-containing protein [Acidovorax sp.]